MAPVHFLDLPITVREQIYAELLLQPEAEGAGIEISSKSRADQNGDCMKLPKDVFVSIMYVNRQIYTESSNVFYSGNLFVLVNLNNYRHSRYADSHIDMMQKFCFCTFINLANESPNNHFAMTIDLYSIDRPADSGEIVRPAFVFSAQTLPHFIMCFANASALPVEIAVAKFRIQNTFRYSLGRFSQRMFARLLAAKQFPDFKALSVHGPIDSEYLKRLMRKLPYDQESIWFKFAGVFATHRSSMLSSLAVYKAKDDTYIQLKIKELTQLLACVDIVWDFHSYLGFPHNQDYAQASLFQSTADVWGMLVLAHLLRAKRCGGDPKPFYILARQAAEEGISYLNQENRFIDARTFESMSERLQEENLKMVNRAKAQLSLKAYKACTKLKDRTAARRYIISAHRRDRDIYPNSQELLLKLHFKDMDDDPLADRNWPAVLWRDPDGIDRTASNTLPNNHHSV